MELIRPIEAAAADSPRVSVGSTQYDGAQAHNNMPVSESHNIFKGKPCPGITVKAKKPPASAKGMLVWRIRSCMRSDDCPMNQTAPTERMKGKVDNQVEETIENPEAF